MIDAGSKSFVRRRRRTAVPGARRRPRATGPPLDFLTEEHGVGHVRAGATSRSAIVWVIPLHVCSCVNLFDVAAGVRDGVIERELAIAGRGMSR